MTLSQSLLPIVIFWAIIGGLGASLLLPAMQSLIHGNFAGRDAAAGLRARRRRGRDRRRGRAARRRLHHHVPLVARRVPRRGRDHRDRPARDRAGPRRPVHGRPAASTSSARSCPRSAWAASSSGSSSGRREAAAVGALIAVGVVALGSLAWWLVKRKREGKPALLDADLFRSKYFRLGITVQTLQQIALGGLMIALPIFLQMVLEYNAMGAGLSLAPLSLSMFAVALLAGQEGRATAARARSSAPDSCCSAVGVAVLIPIVPRAHSGWSMVVPLLIAGAGLGLLVSQLNNYTLSPIEEERVSEAAGVNSAGGSFGLSFGLAFAGAIMLASLSLVFTHLAEREQGALAGRAGAGLEGPREERRGDDATRTSRSCSKGQPRRRAGGDPPHQHEGAADRAADRAAGAAARRAARPRRWASG